MNPEKMRFFFLALLMFIMCSKWLMGRENGTYLMKTNTEMKTNECNEAEIMSEKEKKKNSHEANDE